MKYVDLMKAYMIEDITLDGAYWIFVNDFEIDVKFSEFCDSFLMDCKRLREGDFYYDL